ncbi:MAG: transglutaminase family protein [Burkholderiaceae bacterium]|nr:transglutaminase family protein [Burkholderiaceae bacterium]
MRLSIEHTTRYRYTEALSRAVQQLYLWPSNGPTQAVQSWHVRAPAPVQVTQDGLGNLTGHFTFDGHTQELTLTATGVVQTMDVSGWVEAGPVYTSASASGAGAGAGSGAVARTGTADSTLGSGDAADSPLPWVHPAFYLRSGKLSTVEPRITQWARDVVGVAAGQPVAVSQARALQLATAVSNKVQYSQGRTDVQTHALEAFDWGAGVCQDQAHTMLAACRGLGWPARYVSGYLYAPNQPELASHAWVDVCLAVDPNSLDAQWLSVDITQACLTTDQYVRLAIGSDYASCAPSKGMRVGGGEEAMSVDVRITLV